MNTADIEALVTPVAASHGLEVDRTEVLNAGKRAVVRIFLDGDGDAGRGPSLDQISAATRDISTALDEADLTKGRPYTLEVSSRGVNRPLTEAKHFRRNTGRLVTFSLAASEVTGRILGLDGESVVADVDGIEQSLPLADIRRAVVQVELNRPAGSVDGDLADEEA